MANVLQFQPPSLAEDVARVLSADAAWDRMAAAALDRDDRAYEAAKRDFRGLIEGRSAQVLA